MPSAAGIEFVRLLGRSMRFRRTAEQEPETPYPAPPHVPLLGRWLTHFGERARVPGASLLLSMTGLLTRHWASGQSVLEDQHLGALLSWIDPPPGLSGQEAAERAESARGADGQLLCPPAGPATDPAFDNRLLAPAMARYDAGLPGAEDALRALVEGQLRPTWDAVWHGLDLLRALPAGSRVPDRWKRDRWSYTAHRDRVRAGEPPQPRQDDAVTAAQKLSARETAQAQLDAQEALDDPLVMAGRRLAGEAFQGTVTAVEMAFSEGKRPMPRPLVTLRTADRPQLSEGGKLHRALADGRTQTAEFVAAAGRGAGCAGGAADGRDGAREDTGARFGAGAGRHRVLDAVRARAARRTGAPGPRGHPVDPRRPPARRRGRTARLPRPRDPGGLPVTRARYATALENTAV